MRKFFVITQVLNGWGSRTHVCPVSMPVLVPLHGAASAHECINPRAGQTLPWKLTEARTYSLSRWCSFSRCHCWSLCLHKDSQAPDGAAHHSGQHTSVTCTHTHAEIQRHTDTHHCLQGGCFKEPPLLLCSVFIWIPKVCSLKPTVNPVWRLVKWQGTKAVGCKGPDALGPKNKI